MTCALEEHFGRLADQIPEDESGDVDFRFTEANLLLPPESLSTDQVCLTWHYHYYNSFPVDGVTIELNKRTCRNLGLAVLAMAFRSEPERVSIELTHRRSKVRRLIVEAGWYPDGVGLVSRPHCFNYYPVTPERNPWRYEALPPSSMPILYLTNEEDMVSTPEEIALRDVAVGFGPFENAALFANLLLNASLNGTEVVEYKLEGECGNRGVGPGSAEISIYLPGGLGYLDAPPKLQPRDGV